jgi:hypothetical protein
MLWSSSSSSAGVVPNDAGTSLTATQRRPYACFVLSVATVAALLLAPRACLAQGPAQADGEQSYAGQIVKRTLLDPTSYSPAAFLYISSRLDWSSSQPFFQNGSLENNGRYTISGLPVDVPLSNTQGKEQILRDALGVLPLSMANNAATVVLQRALTRFDPEHTRRWVVLMWVERIAFASVLSYALSTRHFQQWHQNDQAAAALGY